MIYVHIASFIFFAYLAIQAARGKYQPTRFVTTVAVGIIALDSLSSILDHFLA